MTELLSHPAQDMSDDRMMFEANLTALHEQGAVIVGAVGRAAIMAAHGHEHPLPLADPITAERLQIAALLPAEYWIAADLQDNSTPAPRYPRLYIPMDSEFAYVGHPEDTLMHVIDKDALGIQERKLGNVPVRTLSIGAQMKLDSLAPDTAGRAWFHFSPGEFRAFATPLSYRWAMYPQEFLPGSDYVAFDRARWPHVPTVQPESASETLHG